MAFVRAKIEIKPASIGTGVKASLRKERTRTFMQLSFSVSRAESFGWAHGDCIEVLLGTGEQHGLIRVRKDGSQGQTTISRCGGPGKANYFRLPLGPQPGFVDRTEAATLCEWEAVEDGWIEIVLPKWADETAPNKAKQAAPSPVKLTPLPAPAQRGGNVTAALMGDPDPQRSALFQRKDA